MGPNEYHKGAMISVVKVKHDEIMAGLAPRLFKSDRTGLADGAQQRDFIYVDDVVDIMLWLLDHPVSGLFNVGTGKARSYAELAEAVCVAAGVAPRIDFVPMPDTLRGQYQSFTEAPMKRLRAAGYAGQFTPLEQGISRYVQGYLAAEDRYR
jgi:ADP-L-glycero-D-manno-heptose 6-epimerase